MSKLKYQDEHEVYLGHCIRDFNKMRSIFVFSWTGSWEWYTKTFHNCIHYKDMKNLLSIGKFCVSGCSECCIWGLSKIVCNFYFLIFLNLKIGQSSVGLLVKGAPHYFPVHLDLRNYNIWYGHQQHNGSVSKWVPKLCLNMDILLIWTQSIY